MDCGVPSWQGHVVLFAAEGCSMPTLLQSVATASSRCSLVSSQVISHQSTKPRGSTTDATTSSSSVACLAPIKDVLTIHHIESTAVVLVPSGNLNVPGGGGGGFNPSKRELSVASIGGVSTASGGNLLGGSFFSLQQGEKPTASVSSSASPSLPMPPLWSLVSLRMVPFNWRPYAVGPRLGPHMYHSVTLTRGATDTVLVEHALRTSLVAITSSDIPPTYSVTSIKVPHSHPTTSSRDTPIAPLRDNHTNKGTDIFVTVALSTSLSHLHAAHTHMVSALVGQQGDSTMVSIQTTTSLVVPISFIAANQVPSPVLVSDFACVGYDDEDGVMSLPSRIQPATPLYRSVGLSLESLRIVLRDHRDDVASSIQQKDIDAKDHSPLLIYDGATPTQLPPVGIMGGTSSTSLGTTASTRQLPNSFTFLIGCGPPPSVLTAGYSSAIAIITDLNTTILSELTPLVKNMNLAAVGCRSVLVDGALVISGVVPLVSTHGWQTVLDILHTVSPSLLLLPPTRMVGAGAPMVTFLLPISTSRSFSILKARGDISVILGRLRAVCACVDLVMGPIIPYLCESVETPHQHNSMLDRFSHCLTAVATTNVLALRLTKWVSQSRRSNITFTMRALTWIEATLPGDPLLVLPVGVDNETGMPRTHNIYSRPSRLQKLDVGGSFEASLYSSEALPPEVSVNGLISTVGSLSGMGDFLCRGPPTQLDGKVTVTAMRIGSDGVLPANNGAAFLLAPHPLLSPELCRLGVIFMCHTSSSSQVVDEARGGILCSVTLDASSLHSTNMLVGSPEDGYYINHDSIPALAALHAATASSSSRPAVQERLMPLTVRTTTAVPNGHPSLTPSGAHIVLVGINLRHPHPTDFDRQLSACVGLAPLYGGTQVGGVTPQQQHDAIGEGSRSSKPITESILFYAFITLLDAFEFAIDLGSKLRYIPQALSSLHTDVQRSVLRLTTLSLIADANVSWDYTLGRLWLSPLCLERVHNEMRSVRGLTDDKGTIVEEPILLAPSALYAALPDHHRRGTVEVNMTTTPAGSFLLRGGLLDEDTTTTPPPSVVCICRSQSIPVGGIQLQLDPTPTSPTPTNNWALAPFQRTLVGPTAVTFLLPSPSAVAELRSLLSCLLAMPVTGTRTVALGESQSTLHGDAVEVFEVDARCVAPPRSTSTTSSQSLPPPLFTLTFIMDLRTSSSEPGVGPNNNNTSYFNRKTLASHTTIPHTFCELLVSCAVRHNKCGMGAISTQSVDPVLRINAQYVSSASTVDPSSFVASTVTIDAAALVSHRAFIDGYQSELASTYYTNPASPLLVVIPSSSTQHQQEGTTVMYPHCIGIDGVDTKMSFGPMSDVGAKHLHTYLSDPSTWSNRVFQPRSGGSGSAMPSGATEFPAQLLRLRDAPLPSSFSNTPFTASADISWGGGCLVVATTHSSISLSHLLAGVYSALVPLQGQCRAVPLTRGVATNRGGSATQLSFLLVPTSSATTVISEALQLLSNHPFTTTTPSRVIFAVSAPLSQWNGDGDWRCQMMSSGGLPTLLDIPMLEAPLLDKIAQSMATTPIPTTANTDNADGESNQHVIVVEEESAQAYFGATTPYPYLPPISGVSLSYVSIGHPSSSSSTLLFEAPTETDLANTQRRDNQQLEASVSATYHTLRFKSGSTPMDAPLVVSALLTTMRLLTTVVDIVSQTASVDGTRLQWVLREPTCVVDGTLQPSLVSGRVKQISSICRSVAGLVVTHDELPSGGWLSCAGRGLEGVSVAPCLKGKEPSPTHGSVALVSASPQFWQWLRSTAPNVGGLHIRPRVPGVPSVLEVSGVGAEGGAYDWMKDLTSTLPYGCLLSVVPGTEDPSNPHPGGASLPNNHAGGGGVRGGGGEWVGVPIGVQVGGGDGVDKGVQWEDQHCIDWDMPPQSPVGGGADGDAARADGGTPGSYNPRVPSKPGAPLFGLNGGGGAMKGPAQITMHVCTADDPDELMRGGSSNAKKSTTTQHHRPGTGANRQVAIDGTWHMAPKAPRLPNHEYAKGYVRVGSARPQQPPSPRKGG